MRIFAIGKSMVIARGLPGSGKSTLAQELGKGGIVLSSDDYFMVNGEYKYDPSMRGNAHAWNQGRARRAIAAGVTPVVIDNTNVTWGEVSPYVKMAKEAGYEISYAEPSTPWKFDVDELTRRNKHGVPKDAIQKMLDKWQPTESLGMDKTASSNQIDPTGFAKSGRLTSEERELFSILMGVINDKSPGTTVRVAGGWVRDKLMGKQPKDLDLVVDMGGPEFAKMVTDSLGLSGPHVIRANPDQSKHIETARMYIPVSGNKLEIDVAKLRQDVYEGDSRIPTTSDATPAEDASRRDLTINAMFYNVNRDEIEDFTGKGLVDLRDQVIRTPLEPMKTFKDDPLRMLRCIRFAARYGWDIEPETKKAIWSPQMRADLKKKVSRERKGIELKDMLSSGNPDVAIAILLDSGIFEDMLGDSLSGTDRTGRMSGVLMDQNNPHHDLNWAEHTKALARGLARKYRGQDKEKVFQVMMAALLHDVGKLDSASRQQKEDRTTYHGHEDASKEITEAFMRFVKLEPFSKPVEALVGSHMRPHALSSSKNVKALRRFIREMAELGIDWSDVVNMASADALAKGGKPDEGSTDGYARLIADGEEAAKGMAVSQGSGVKPVLNGQEIMDAFGIKAGPEVGKMLKAVKDMMDEKPDVSKDEAMAMLKDAFPQEGRQASSAGWLARGVAMESLKSSLG